MLDTYLQNTDYKGIFCYTGTQAQDRACVLHAYKTMKGLVQGKIPLHPKPEKGYKTKISKKLVEEWVKAKRHRLYPSDSDSDSEEF